MRTRQQAYDIAKRTILEQGGYGWDPDTESCEYLTDDGERCAVGALLPKGSVFETAIGGVRAFVQNEEFWDDVGMGRGDIDFLDELQAVHDELATKAIFNPEEWILAMEKFAAEWGLTP